MDKAQCVTLSILIICLTVLTWRYDGILIPAIAGIMTAYAGHITLPIVKKALSKVIKNG